MKKKEAISYKDFCNEKGFSMQSKQAQAEYQSYIAELEIENRPYIDEVREKAQEVLRKLSKKK